MQGDSSKNMDKELLLAMDDSDDVVEEFKLPPARNRRAKHKKAVNNNGGTRVASPDRSHILSWKCALIFILMTVFVSGSMVIAFFLLNMQAQLDSYKLQLDKVQDDQSSIVQADITKSSRLKQINSLRLDKIKKDITELRKQINAVNITANKLQGSSTIQLSHRFKLIENDVDSMKTGMAKTGGDIDKLRDDIDGNSDQFDKLDDQISSMNTSAGIKHEMKQGLEELQTQFVESRKTFEASTALELSKLKTFIDSLHFTHTDDMQKHEDKFTQIQNILELLKPSVNQSYVVNATKVENSKDMNKLTNEVHNIERLEPNFNIITQLLHDMDRMKNETKIRNINTEQQFANVQTKLEELQGNFISFNNKTVHENITENNTVSNSNITEVMMLNIASLQMHVDGLQSNMAVHVAKVENMSTLVDKHHVKIRTLFRLVNDTLVAVHALNHTTTKQIVHQTIGTTAAPLPLNKSGTTAPSTIADTVTERQNDLPTTADTVTERQNDIPTTADTVTTQKNDLAEQQTTTPLEKESNINKVDGIQPPMLPNEEGYMQLATPQPGESDNTTKSDNTTQPLVSTNSSATSMMDVNSSVPSTNLNTSEQSEAISTNFTVDTESVKKEIIDGVQPDMQPSTVASADTIASADIVAPADTVAPADLKVDTSEDNREDIDQPDSSSEKGTPLNPEGTPFNQGGSQDDVDDSKERKNLQTLNPKWQTKMKTEMKKMAMKIPDVK